MAAKRVLLNTLIVVGVVLGLYVLYRVANVLVLMFVAILFATAIAPLVDRLRSRIGLGQAVLIIYFGLGLSLGILFFLLFQMVVEQVTTLAKNLPAIMASLQGYATSVEVPFLKQLLEGLLTEISTALSLNEPTAPGNVAQGVVTVTASLATIGFAFFSVLVIAYYWIAERSGIMRLCLSLFPSEQRPQVCDVWHEVEVRLGGWVRGQLLLMLSIAVMFGLGFAVMGVKYALLLAVFAGVTELVPIVGPWLGGVPAVLVALTQSFWLAVAVAIYAMIVQTIEGNVFVPRILAGTIGISPLLVLVAILIGVSLMGMVGALLAVPIASALHAVAQSLWADMPSTRPVAPAAVSDLGRRDRCE